MKNVNRAFFAFLRRINTPLSYLLKPLEDAKCQKFREAGSSLGPIFILGPPRCGSTFTYQLLSENFLLEYIDNLTHLFYRTLYLGNRFSHSIYNDQPHGNFSSKAGNTIHAGWHAPSECPPFWYRAIPKQNHWVSKEDLDQKAINLISDPIYGIMGRTRRPLLIKNLFMVERIPLIKEIFPHARYLILKRDRLQTGRSILNQRKKLGIPEDQWWSVRPRNYQDLQYHSVEEKTAAQIHYLEEQIDEELKEVPPQRKFNLHYEELTKDPEQSLDHLRTTFFEDISLRTGSYHYPPTGSSRPTDKDEDLKRVEEGFLKLGIPYER